MYKAVQAIFALILLQTVERRLYFLTYPQPMDLGQGTALGFPASTKEVAGIAV
jgi:hypothetical protein